MSKIKLNIEVETNKDSRVSVYVLSNYILRAIAGVAGANKAMILQYNCSAEKEG